MHQNDFTTNLSSMMTSYLHSSIKFSDSIMLSNWVSGYYSITWAFNLKNYIEGNRFTKKEKELIVQD